MCQERGPVEKHYADWSIEDLKAELVALPDDERRAALSMLGLAFGDAAGLPFELRHGIHARAQFRKLNSEFARHDLARELVVRRVLSRPPLFARAYSDDTTCCDLKIEAACRAELLDGQDIEDNLRLAMLQQYLRWAHGAKTGARAPGTPGELFQGTGGFTQNFLVPHFRGRKNEVTLVMGDRPLFNTHKVLGEFFPTEDFANFAAAYFRGEYGFPSWGNGAVMSFAPHPVLAGRWRRRNAIGAGLAAAAPILSKSHQEPTAVLGADLLWEVLDAVYAGAVGHPRRLRRIVAGLPKALEVCGLEHECVPVQAFKEWLEEGDCEVATAEAFLRRLTGTAGPFKLSPAPKGVFGELLHIAADWNDDQKVHLMRHGTKEPVLFSQRGLNSVFIALWAASEATSPWQVMDRVIYVGGDTDTIGAVAGQVACPLLDVDEVVGSFVEFAGVGPNVDTDAARVASAAARRFFRRAILFAAGNLQELRSVPGLLDVSYPPLTRDIFKKGFEEEASRL